MFGPKRIFCILIFAASWVSQLSVFAQASVVAGSVTTSKTSYTVGTGKNRLLVVAVTGEVGAGPIGTITGVTWGGQPLTQALTQGSPVVTPVLRTDIWYLNEAGISAARGSCTYNFIVTWSSVPTNEVFAALTLRDVDQTTPVANANSAEVDNVSAIQPGNVVVGVDDIMVYASSSNQDRTHASPGTYTEHSDQTIGGAGGTSMATASRVITVAGNENPTATWATGNSRLANVGVGFNGVTATNVITYYSRNATSGGDWDNANSWTLNSDGTGGPLAAGVWPARNDHVVVRSGHTITINATDDNKQCGVSPDGLARTNIGAGGGTGFNGSNVAMFYQTGDITINGTLNVTGGINMMLEGYTRITATGTFFLTSYLVNVGYLEADPSSTLTTLDDISLTGNSITIINNSSTTADDLNIDFTNATLCGTGTQTLLNSGGSAINYTNAATVNQICTTFVVNCSGGGCSGFPVTGTGSPTTGSTGPGGVGSNSGNSSLKIWFRVDNGLNTTGTDINSWTNSAGVAALDISETSTQRPTLVANAINGFSEVSFNGSNRLRTGLTLTTSNFVTDRASSFTVNRADNTAQTTSVYLTDPLEVNRFSNHIPWSGTVYYDIGNCCGNDARIQVGALAGLTGYSIWSYDANPTTGKQLYRNGTQLQDRAGTSTYSSHATHRFNIGANTTGSAGFQGDVTEIIIFNERINQAQRIVIQNYLSAKYDIALTADDFYAMDSPGNGNFDFEVAGVGQAADNSNHLHARGSGIVGIRVLSPTSLTSNEFLLWGHNNGLLVGSVVDVGAPIQERLSRIWRVSETGDVGSVAVSFDISGLGGLPLGPNLRLLIDRDGDGFADNDVTPIGGGTFSGNIVTFTGVNLQNGDRFTLGNTDLSSPLPIELISFTAQPRASEIELKWSTASEQNNDFFTIQRSQDAEQWEEVRTIQGAGTKSDRTDYETTDDFPYPGVSYYRLKQTDFDGQFSFSHVRRVEISRFEFVKVYPNPSSEAFNIVAGLELQPENVKLYDIMGREIPVRVERAGSITKLLPENVAPGIYILRVSKGLLQESVRVVVE